MKALPGHWRVRSETREDKHMLMWFDPIKLDHKVDPTKESKSSFSPEKPKSKILRGYCGDQLYPVLKPRWKRPDPISDLICTSCVRRGQAQCPIWGWENVRGQSTKEEIRFSSEERWRTLVGIWPCPRTIVTSGLLFEVSGELISHLE